MKRLILLITLAMISVGCNKNDKDCDCSRQRWERKATYTVVSSNGQNVFISATEWQKSGNPESIESDDCSKNGTVAESGSENGTLNSGNSTYTVTEFEYRITCQ